MLIALIVIPMLAALAINLGADRGELERHFGSAHTSFLRLNYYPVCPTPAARGEGAAPSFLGVNQHTYAGVLTLLLQDGQPGLEVFRAGKWHLVEPLTDDRFQLPS